jgi:hypothetical protein
VNYMHFVGEAWSPSTVYNPVVMKQVWVGPC